MENATLAKWITGGLELIIGIPFVGGMIILSLAWAPLWVMLILHLITLFLCVKDDKRKLGSIMGIIASILGWIPIVGMTLHLVAGGILIFDAVKGH